MGKKRAKKVVNMKTFGYKIPPYLPLSKGGTLPLFGKEGEGRFI